jgi:outer membrane protein assembly factor BamB
MLRGVLMILRFCTFALLPLAMCAAGDWPQFRGPNASGTADEKGLPVEFGPSKNVVWKTALPGGHSSPILVGDRIFVTAFEGKKLLTICLDRATGKVLWRREAPRDREQKLHKSNSPASPSPVSDGKNVYVFFTDYGLVSYGPDGNDRWRVPLGPFNNPFGMGASPVLAGNLILMLCDSESGSFMVAVEKDSGRTKWRVERPDVTRGFSTPVLYKPKDGPLQALVSGSYRLVSYAAETGDVVWWTGGLTWQLKPTPVLGRDVLYVLGWAGGSDTGQQEDVPPFDEVLRRWDANHDGKLAKTEISDEKIARDWDSVDLDVSGFVEERDWKLYQSRRAAQNGMNAFRLGGKGDMTGKSLMWRYTKSLPNAVSPLLYNDVLYLAKEGGIMTALDPATGNVHKQARLTGAPGFYYSSPVGADGKVFTASEEGKVSVLKAGPQWEILAVNAMDDSIHATPAIADGRIYLRTHSALYCFGEK